METTADPETWGPVIRHFARRNRAAAQALRLDAADVEQEMWARLLAEHKAGRIPADAGKGLIYGVLQRRLIDWLRSETGRTGRHKPPMFPVLEVPAEPVADFTDTACERMDAVATIRRLPPDLRSVYVASLSGLSYTEVGAARGVTKSRVCQLMRQAHELMSA